jgi:plastocyanin
MHQRFEAMALGTAFLFATACGGGSTMSTSPMAGSVASGGHSSTIVASGSSGSPSGPYGGGSSNSTYSFSPVPDTVAAGTVVTFQFEDVAHTVTFDQTPAPIANIPATANADSTRTFTTPGTYTYHCSIHTYMHGTVVAQ